MRNMKLIQGLLASCFTAFVMVIMKKKVELFLMRYFRDLSRFKSRRRLYGNEAALIPILLGMEKSVKSPIDNLDPNLIEKWTSAELSERDGRTDETPIFIAVKGHIYDVSYARHMYGPGKTYHALVGRDASYAFATSCYQPKCLIGSLDTLSKKQKKELDRWDELYYQHDKYKFVGLLVDTSDPVDEYVSKAIHEESSSASAVTEDDIDSEPEKNNIQHEQNGRNNENELESIEIIGSTDDDDDTINNNNNNNNNLDSQEKDA